MIVPCLGQIIQHKIIVVHVLLCPQVAYAIKEGVVSGHLPNSTACVYINITTMEGERYCIRLSMRGFEVHTHTTVVFSVQFAFV